VQLHVCPLQAARPTALFHGMRSALNSNAIRGIKQYGDVVQIILATMTYNNSPCAKSASLGSRFSMGDSGQTGVIISKEESQDQKDINGDGEILMTDLLGCRQSLSVDAKSAITHGKQTSCSPVQTRQRKVRCLSRLVAFGSIRSGTSSCLECRYCLLWLLRASRCCRSLKLCDRPLSRGF